MYVSNDRTRVKELEGQTRRDVDESGAGVSDTGSGREDGGPRGAVGDRLVDADIRRRRGRRGDRATYMRAISAVDNANHAQPVKHTHI